MKDMYGFVTCVKKSLHSVVVINKTFKIPTVKPSGYNTDYIVVLIFVLIPDGSIYIDRDLSCKIGCWLVNQHQRRWQDLSPSQRQAQELISGPNRGTRAKFLFLNREQSRVVTGLLTGHNTLCRHLHLTLWHWTFF
jgi:hypothetical protein